VDRAVVCPNVPTFPPKFPTKFNLRCSFWLQSGAVTERNFKVEYPVAESFTTSLLSEILNTSQAVAPGMSSLKSFVLDHCTYTPDV
jgi:hypothetical protein